MKQEVKARCKVIVSTPLSFLEVLNKDLLKNA
jgi:hypothetical protein